MGRELYAEGPALNTLLEKFPVLSEGEESVGRVPPVDGLLTGGARQEAGHGTQVSGPDEGCLALLQQDVDGEDAGLDEEERGDRHAHLLHGVEEVQTAIFIFRLLRALAKLQWNVVSQTVDLRDPPHVDPSPLLVPVQLLPLEAAEFTLTEEPVTTAIYIYSVFLTPNQSLKPDTA